MEVPLLGTSLKCEMVKKNIISFIVIVTNFIIEIGIVWQNYSLLEQPVDVLIKSW